MKLDLTLDLGANHKILLLNNPNFSLTKTSNTRIAEGISGSIYGSKTFSKTIRIGSVAYTNTEILIPTKTTYHQESRDLEKHGAIGGRLFEKSTIILDYINGYLFIENQEERIRPSSGFLTNR